jgi:glycosyltransferase involved in cell wall biosynthesis
MGEHNVVLLGGYDFEYPREKSLKDGLELQGYDVLECRYADEQVFISPRKLLLLPLFYVRLYRRFREVEREAGEFEAVLVTKFNHLLLPLAWVLARRHGCPLVYDAFVSLQGTVEMRGAHPFVVRSLALLERLTMKLPDRHIIGTQELADLNARLSRVPVERFSVVPPGADEDRFYPRDVPERETFTVLYWGNHLPHHGLETILRAADVLRDREDVQFVILGEGPMEAEMKALAANLELENVSFEGRVPWDDLFEWIAASQVCLGVFSKRERAMASITNKVAESVAMGRPTITERSPAAESWFEHREHVYMVPPEDPHTLADAILTLKRDSELRGRLAAGARRKHEEEFTIERIGQRLAAAVSEASGRQRAAATADAGEV